MKARSLIVIGLVTACAHPPRPASLVETDRTRTSAAMQQAAVLAPQAYLAAEKLRAEAEQADRDGDRAGAQILGEQALAAYAHADVLARLAKADERLAVAKARAERGRAELGALEQEEATATTEADDAEMRLRVTRDALPLPASEPATPDRERARLAAARAIAQQARLLCVATQMLVPDGPALSAALKSLDTLEIALAKTPAHPPIDEAVRLRSACLTELTAARRVKTALAPEAGEPDGLLDVLGKAGFEPSRDDRGVFVVLRDAFQSAALKPAAKEKIAALAEVARAHPDFPVLVVTHASRGGKARDATWGDVIAGALREAGAPKVESRSAGDVLPVVPPQSSGASARNERIEIVFVAPAS